MKQDILKMHDNEVKTGGMDSVDIGISSAEGNFDNDLGITSLSFNINTEKFSAAIKLPYRENQYSSHDLYPDSVVDIKFSDGHATRFFQQITDGDEWNIIHLPPSSTQVVGMGHEIDDLIKSNIHPDGLTIAIHKVNNQDMRGNANPYTVYLSPGSLSHDIETAIAENEITSETLTNAGLVETEYDFGSALKSEIISNIISPELISANQSYEQSLKNAIGKLFTDSEYPSINLISTLFKIPSSYTKPPVEWIS